MNEPDAAVYIGRSRRSLRNWRSNGLIPARRRGGEWVYLPADLTAARDKADQRMRQGLSTASKPGPGRGHKHPARSRIRELIEAGGMSQLAIARAIGCNASLVAVVNRELKTAREMV
ncbi:helix-turn-helix domain-containing protein [Rhodococcus sp. BH4]|uniref:helix-turn-helix domain-containing protein n=1 Tax=Rhodococcus sp. BH4 TaxID=1807790 RepID=UPI0012EBF1AF